MADTLTHKFFDFTAIPSYAKKIRPTYVIDPKAPELAMITILKAALAT